MTKDHTDFREANDSPVSALRLQAANLMHRSATDPDVNDRRDRKLLFDRGVEYSTAATFLQAQEIQNQVTFVTLDNGTLDWLLDVVNDYRNEKDPDEKLFLAESAVRRVIDLLGLED